MNQFGTWTACGEETVVVQEASENCDGDSFALLYLAAPAE
jgi:hypothetical protein